jgi:hypothetical protein
MKKTTSTIPKEQEDWVEVDGEKFGNKSPLIESLKLLQKNCFHVSQKHFVTNYHHLRTPWLLPIILYQ